MKQPTHINTTTIISTIISVATIVGLSIKINNNVATKEDVKAVENKVGKVSQIATTNKEDVEVLKIMIDTATQENREFNNDITLYTKKIYKALDLHIRNQGGDYKNIMQELDKLNGLNESVVHEKKNDTTTNLLPIQLTRL